MAGGLMSHGPARQRRSVLARIGPLAYWIVLAGLVAALVIIRQGVHLLKSGTLVLAGVLLVAAVARLVLPEGQAGMLSSRRRMVDVAIFAALGIGLLVAGLVVPMPS
jgi:peptidoglycan/LPS O-acetylase OafA/YrhL